MAPGNPDIARIVAPNPGPMTLEGTNTYLVGSDPAYLIDPGLADDRHLTAIRRAAAERGGLGGILLTHSHTDHTAAAPAIDAPLLWGQVGQGDETSPASSLVSRLSSLPAEPGTVGPFTVVPTPGHAADHVCFVRGRVCFCGDLVLGHGSSIVPPAAWGGSLADYMASLQRIGELDLHLLAPGHGPWITDPATKIAEYLDHRIERERRLLAALDAGERSRGGLLDAVWDDVPEPMRPMAAVAMQAHLEKLGAEGALPDGLHD